MHTSLCNYDAIYTLPTPMYYFLSKSAYVKETDEARLPLGEEFQKHVNVFLKVKTGPGGGMVKKENGDFNKAYKRALKLIDQLE